MGKFAYKEVLQIKGYPPSLKVVKHGKSRFYWVHFSTYVASKGTIKIRKSTKTEVQNEAIRFAKEFYEDLIVKKKMGDFPVDNTFGRYTTKLITLNDQRVKNNTYSLSQFNNDKYRIENDLVPFFAELDITEVSYLTISNFINLLVDKGFKINSQKKYLTLIRKVMNLALEDGTISELPKFPDSNKLKVKTKKHYVPYPKGRTLDQKASDDIKSLINGTPVRRDLLIEYLHLIQDRFRCIKKKHLAALSDIMKIPFAEAFEVASFYAHFDVIDDDSPQPPEITLRVCDSLTCELKGSDVLIKNLKKKYHNSDKVRVLRAPCMGLCDHAPACEVGHNHLKECSIDSIETAIKTSNTHPQIIDGISLDSYISNGGYKTLRKCYEKELSVETVIEKLENAGLKGMGGAGFPSGQKWKFVRMEPGPRLMTINGDEGEPVPPPGNPAGPVPELPPGHFPPMFPPGLSGSQTNMNIASIVGINQMSQGIMSRIKGKMNVPVGAGEWGLLGQDRPQPAVIQDQVLISNDGAFTPSGGSASLSETGIVLPGRTFPQGDAQQAEYSEVSGIQVIPNNISTNNITITATIDTAVGGETFSTSSEDGTAISLKDFEPAFAKVTTTVTVLETGATSEQTTVIPTSQNGIAHNLFNNKLEGADVPGNHLEVVITRVAGEDGDTAQTESIKLKSIGVTMKTQYGTQEGASAIFDTNVAPR